MWLRSLIAFCLTCLVVLAAAGSPAFAQRDSSDFVRPPQPDSPRYRQRVAPRYQPGPAYGDPYQPSPGYERYRAQPQYGARYRPQPAPPPSSSGFFFPWFQPSEPSPQPTYQPE